MTRRSDPPHSASVASLDTPHVEPLLDITDVAIWLNTTVRHLRRLVSERRIPFHKIGAKVRFDRRELEGWIAGSLVPAHDERNWLAASASLRRPAS